MKTRHRGHGNPRGVTQFPHDDLMYVDRQFRQKECEQCKLTGDLNFSKQMVHNDTSGVKFWSCTCVVAMIIFIKTKVHFRILIIYIPNPIEMTQSQNVI